MKKLVSALVGLSLLTAPAMADARSEHWHGGYHRGPGILAPLIIGGIVGAVIVDSTRPREVVVAPPAPVYHAVVVASYYDVYRGTCEVRDTYDQYNNFVYRQTVCYGR